MLEQQKLSYKEKTKIDPVTGETWGTRQVKNLASKWGYNQQHREIISLHEAVNGHIDKTEYSYLLKPFGLKEGEKFKVGARLRNYNILKGIANLLIGEYGRRIHEYTVVGYADNDDNLYEQGLSMMLTEYVKQKVVNTLNERGMLTGQPSVDQPTIEEAVAQYDENFKRARIEMGQDSIDFIRYDQKIDEKILDVYWDWIVTGRAVTYKTIRHNNVYYEHVPVEELTIPNETHSNYIEDMSWAVRRYRMSVNKILDVFHDELEESDIEYLDTRFRQGSSDITGGSTTDVPSGGFIYLPSVSGDRGSGYVLDNKEGLEVFHCVWKSFRKVGTLTYIDELGQVSELEVDETYKLDKANGDISIKWSWINETWQGWKIEDMYLGIAPLVENRSDINNDSEQKLPYNGIMTRSKSGELDSLIKQGLPYQVIINGIHYQVEKLINKNKDKLIVMPYGLVPRNKGMSTKDVMYHADATSILWVDETSPNAQVAASMIKALDVSLGNYIKDLIEIMKFVKQEYWDSIGMNAQRYSDIDQKAGKGITEQAIIRSSVITNELNRQFDKLIESDYQGLLDFSKLAWIGGKKGKFIRTDGSSAFLEMNEENAIFHSEASYGVFVKDSSELTENLQAIRNLALPFLQNQGNLEGAIELYNNKNMERLKGIVARIEKANRDLEASREQAAQESAERIQESIAEQQEKDREVKYYEIDMEYSQTVDSATIRSERDNSRNTSREPNDVERALAEHKIRKEERELEQKDKALKQKDKDIKLKQQKDKSNTNNKS